MSITIRAALDNVLCNMRWTGTDAVLAKIRSMEKVHAPFQMKKEVPKRSYRASTRKIMVLNQPEE
ncbi:MAG: hypothetical protein RR975_15070, partial [Clostridia bacterium]